MLLWRRVGLKGDQEEFLLFIPDASAWFDFFNTKHIDLIFLIDEVVKMRIKDPSGASLTSVTPFSLAALSFSSVWFSHLGMERVGAQIVLCFNIYLIPQVRVGKLTEEDAD